MCPGTARASAQRRRATAVHVTVVGIPADRGNGRMKMRPDFLVSSSDVYERGCFASCGVLLVSFYSILQGGGAVVSREIGSYRRRARLSFVLPYSLFVVQVPPKTSEKIGRKQNYFLLVPRGFPRKIAACDLWRRCEDRESPRGKKKIRRADKQTRNLPRRTRPHARKDPHTTNVG